MTAYGGRRFSDQALLNEGWVRVVEHVHELPEDFAQLSRTSFAWASNGAPYAMLPWFGRAGLPVYALLAYRGWLNVTVHPHFYVPKHAIPFLAYASNVKTDASRRAIAMLFVEKLAALDSIDRLSREQHAGIALAHQLWVRHRARLRRLESEVRAPALSARAGPPEPPPRVRAFRVRHPPWASRCCARWRWSGFSEST